MNVSSNPSTWKFLKVSFTKSIWLLENVSSNQRTPTPCRATPPLSFKCTLQQVQRGRGRRTLDRWHLYYIKPLFRFYTLIQWSIYHWRPFDLFILHTMKNELCYHLLVDINESIRITCTNWWNGVFNVFILSSLIKTMIRWKRSLTFKY